jgi:putative hemolysin
VNSVWAKIVLVLIFILVGGFFSATEMALVSLRESQIKALSTRSRRGARVAALASDPSRFLAALQIGVTSAGFMSAAFGAATLADRLTPVLRGWGVPDALAGATALVGVTLIISYVSLVLGELAPKRIALQRTERIALATAGLIDRFATAVKPIVWLLSRSTDLVVRVVGGDPSAGRTQITEEEVRSLVTSHHTFSSEERQLIEDVLEAGDRQLREVMIPRTEVEFLDAGMSVYRAARVVADLPHSRYPVVRGSADEVVGFVHVRDLFSAAAASGSSSTVRVGELARPVPHLPGTKRVLAALNELRDAGHHLAIVADEYGGTAGIVTLEDIVEELVGEIRDEYDDANQAPARRLVTGDLEVDGLLNLADFTDEAGFELPDGPYETVAGFVTAALGHVPHVGESVEVAGHVMTVTAKDGRRIARLEVRPAAGSTDGLRQ